jgi:hypothetical protein
MRHKIKIAVGCVLIITGFLATNIAVGQLTSLQNDTRTKCEGIVIDGGEKTVGRNDADYTLFEEYGTDAEIYACIEDGYFSTPVIEKILNDGRCLGYVEQLKAEGWIPQDFTPAGSKSQNTSSAEAKTETPAETSNETSTTDNKQPEKTEKNNKSETKTETKKEPTQEEIDAAWEETERVEATCTEDGKIVYTNSITGDTKEESIPASGHDYEVTDTTEAACTEDGKNTYTCKVCGDSYEEAIPATGHTEGEWKVTKEAGLFSTGSKEVTCEKCGEVLDTEEIPQTCPLPLAAVIGIVVAVVVIIGVIVVLVRRRKNI